MQPYRRGNVRTMTRTNRIAVLAAIALLVALTGSALANRAPQVADEPAQLAASHEAEGELEAEDTDGAAIARERLLDAEIETDPAEFDALAARYGVGGAVRLYAWAHELEQYSVEDLAKMRDGDGEPVGWGRLAKELGVHPGIGSIMGRGHGPDGPPGLQNKPDRDTDD